jgi:hypothetical protein
MEIRNWFDQQLVLPSDMDDSTSDMYQRNFNYNNFTPMILYGLQLVGVSGNTVSFSVGAARAPEITTISYPYLPTPAYGTGYAGIIEIPAGHNSVTLDPSINPCYIVATYSISPTSPGQTVYTVIGNLSQVSSVDTTKQVVIARATYSSGWTIDQAPGTNRNNDATGLSALQYNLTTNKSEINSPQGFSSTGIVFKKNLYDENNYLLNTSKIDVATTSTPINSLVSSASLIKFTGSTATTVNGIAAGVSSLGAQPLTIYNGSSANITVVDNSGSATAPDRVSCPSGNIVLTPKFSLKLFYDNTAQLWVVDKSA